MSHARFALVFAATSLLVFVGCGGSSGGGKKNADGGSSKDAGQGGSSGKGGKNDDDAGMLSDAGDAGGGDTMPQGSGCDEASGIPTWKVVDPTLPDFGVTQDMNVSAPSVKGFSGIAFGAGMFVALGRGDSQDVFRYATSTDGLTWTAHSQKLANGTLYTISRIHFRNGKFIFFAEQQGDGFHVHYSPDAVS